MQPFENKVYLSSPKMHGEELEYMKQAFNTNWMSTVGENIDAIESDIASFVGIGHAVGLSCGTAAIHLAVKLAGIKPGDKVFCSDLTFSATVNPIVYEGGVPIFIDTELDTWNMDPAALEKAFELHPDTKFIMLVHLYGVPAKIDEIRHIANKYGAVVIEDAAESLGATYKGGQTGSFGDIAALSFNGNKIITGSAGGMLLVDSQESYEKVKKWSTQARESAPWYQHEEIGYNYRISNVVAGVVRGQFPHLQEHIDCKKAIYKRYEEAFEGLPVSMNPYDSDFSEPNFWLSCMTIDNDAMCKQVRSDQEYLYAGETGKTCPHAILDALADLNIEGRPIWKPMHMQPIYRNHAFVTKGGNGRATTNAYIEGGTMDTGADIFRRGVCLPSDLNMSAAQQDVIIDAVKKCFD